MLKSNGRGLGTQREVHDQVFIYSNDVRVPFEVTR